MKHPRPHRQKQRRAHRAGQPLERRAATPRDPRHPEPRDRDRRDRPERSPRHRHHGPLRRRDVRAGRRVVGHRHQPADQLRVNEARDRREQRMDDRDKRRHRQLPDRAADHVPNPPEQTAHHLTRTRQPQDPRLRGSRLKRRHQQRHEERASRDGRQQQVSTCSARALHLFWLSLPQAQVVQSISAVTLPSSSSTPSDVPTICSPRRPPNSSTIPPAISASGAIAATITSAGVTNA